MGGKHRCTEKKARAASTEKARAVRHVRRRGCTRQLMASVRSERLVSVPRVRRSTVPLASETLRDDETRDFGGGGGASSVIRAAGAASIASGLARLARRDQATAHARPASPVLQPAYSKVVVLSPPSAPAQANRDAHKLERREVWKPGARCPARGRAACVHSCGGTATNGNEGFVSRVVRTGPSRFTGVSPDLVLSRPTTAYQDQKPGTSGLRKKTKVFMQKDYLANFTQSVFDCLPDDEKKGGTLLVSGDGRYFTHEAIYEICSIAAGNGVGRVWIGQNGLASTPACSAIIRNRENGVCFGGFLLTASHNPGGIDEDFGVKYDTGNGAPGQERLMNEVCQKSKTIISIKYAQLPKFALDKVGVQVDLNGAFQVEIIDPIVDWLELMKECFHFPAIKRLLALPYFNFVYDAMHGVSGPYAEKLFLEELGAKPECLMRQQPLPDFGGHHPDPNLTYAAELVAKMKVFHPNECDASTPLFGAAGDGDCDRNMILGRGFFVTPSDSVALISLYAEKCIPYLMVDKATGKGGLTGLARSMPTSRALDNVGKKLNKQVYETPTGWKYFTNLMDANLISICGEESFGTGSVHVREKDGLWAVLAWLSILACRNGCLGDLEQEKADLKSGKDVSIAAPATKVEEFVSVRQIVEEFWKEFGRNFYCRYDFENKDSTSAHQMMTDLEELSRQTPADITAKVAAHVDANLMSAMQIESMDWFKYVDPVDQQVSDHQGVRLFLKGGSRIIWRLSGTGSTGATIRVYMERYEPDASKVLEDDRSALKDIAAFALQFCNIKKYIGTDEPTVVT
ncbi:glucosephosphate-mutase GPM1 [Besnoitia besnoiti]|uniref:phosphoglucomutase (alpha-D-glucose-1,6-bisphosphate-dependent) n=1 Tax=Besnoitia besnoiti TaxID=94643 RepID=A0A2A9M9V8_BESBE|nr:glucosephosphate-mutase GPM1 [Besnoitia besnoiti]PFH34775.1 glucosephosphate-mutase GPM1 [Besnoitia besnoiti]